MLEDYIEVLELLKEMNSLPAKLNTGVFLPLPPQKEELTFESIFEKGRAGFGPSEPFRKKKNYSVS